MASRKLRATSWVSKRQMVTRTERLKGLRTGCGLEKDWRSSWANNLPMGTRKD